MGGSFSVMNKNRSERIWSDLPSEIIENIFHKLTDGDVEDIIRVASVCVSWRSVYHQIKPISPPLLFLSNEGILKLKEAIGIIQILEPSNKESCIIFNIGRNTTNELLLPEEVKGKWLSSSTHGWLLTICLDSKPHKLCLLNPFSKARINLPPAIEYKDPGYFRLIKSTSLITSAYPSDRKCVFLLRDNLNLAFCRPGDEKWTMVESFYFPPQFFGCTIFYKGEFYAVSVHGRIFRISCHRNVDASRRVEDLLVPEVTFPANLYDHYLVELEGDLLLMLRLYKPTTRETYKFEVYKLDWGKNEWIEVKNIGNHVILLDKKNGSTLRASGDWKANCIYFICSRLFERYEVGACVHEIGVYDLGTRSIIERIYESSPMHTNPLNWIIPEI